MAQTFKDPLLSIARGVIFIVQAVLAFAAVMLTVGAPLVVFLQERITAELRAEYGDPAAQFPVLALTGLLLLALLVVGLSWLFLRHLRRIIDTVGDGDPFVPANAERLTAMAWLMLAVQALAIPLGALGLYIGTFSEYIGTFSDNPNVLADIDLDLSGIVLVVTLFILARVFRLGAAMRDDLEGTV